MRALLILATMAGPAWAHADHSTHWHASDTWGLALVLLLSLVAIAFSARKGVTS